MLGKELTVQEVEAAFDKAAQKLKEGQQFAFVLKRDFLENKEKSVYANDNSIIREAAIAEIIKSLDASDVVVSTTGKISREVYEQSDKIKGSHAPVSYTHLYADVVTFSTQKTLRGPRGCGVILCKNVIKDKIDRGVFPGMQGGPKADMIAARAVLFKECMTEKYREYQKQVVKNAKSLAKGCMDEGLQLVTGGTDNHLALVKVTDFVESGREAELLLESVGIVTNKNLIPFDTLNSNLTSGIRIRCV